MVLQVNIGQVVSKVLDTMCHMAKEGVRIVKDAKRMPDIVGDSGRITQILFNLVGNALKFTKQGTITVSSRPAQDPDFFCLIVKDTGIGIPPEKHAKIFQAFEQVYTAQSCSVSLCPAKLQGFTCRLCSSEHLCQASQTYL